MKRPYFEVYRSRSQWRFRLRAPNGEIIAQGEGYSTHANCLAGVLAVRKYAPKARTRELP